MSDLNIAIVAPPGHGKTTSIRGIADRSIGINVERKRLPFRGGDKINQAKPNNWAEAWKAYQRAAKYQGDHDIVWVDSFTSLMEMCLEAQGANLREAYGEIKKWVGRLLEMAKDDPKHWVFICHESYIEDEVRGNLRTIRVPGQAWRGLVEKEFNTVLWANVRRDAEGQRHYIFETQSDGVTCAKSPMEMFEAEIPNDLGYVFKKMEEYYGDEPDRGQGGPAEPQRGSVGSDADSPEAQPRSADVLG